MTPTLTPHLTPHLTHEQLCDLILACSPHPLSSDYAVIEQHLRACPTCSEELTRLSRSLTLFRDASTSYASQQLAEMHARKASVLPPPHSLARPLYWACAAALAVAVLAPLSLRHQHSAASAPTIAVTASTQTEESDEALLEEIDQDISASVPSPMRPLANPVATATSTTTGSNTASTKQTREN